MVGDHQARGTHHGRCWPVRDPIGYSEGYGPMSDPWMKFYAADWRANTALRDVSLAARGLWIDLISIMHEAEPYGHLVDKKGQAMTIESLGKIIGSDREEIIPALDELLESEVAKKKKNGVIYSSRMESDEKKRRINRENGKKGGSPLLSKDKGNSGSDKPELTGGVKTQIPEARVQKLEESPKPPLANGRQTVDSIIVRVAEITVGPKAGEKIPLTLRECLEAEESGDNRNPAYALPAEIRRAEVWGMIRGALVVNGMDAKAAGTVIGEMSKKHDLDADDLAKAAVIVWRANPRAAKPYFVSVCERIANERRN